MNQNNPKTFILRLFQGALIGLGAVLPGISGGVLCVIFGIYKPIMELLSDPFHALKKHLGLLIPVLAGGALGFLGVAKLLGFFLTRYENPSVCLFVGLIAGMIPSLFREASEKGRSKKDYPAMIIACAVIFTVLIGLNVISVSIEPNLGWNIFSGFCVAMSVIAPGMSFSTLLMPLGLYRKKYCSCSETGSGQNQCFIRRKRRRCFLPLPLEAYFSIRVWTLCWMRMVSVKFLRLVRQELPETVFFEIFMKCFRDIIFLLQTEF